MFELDRRVFLALYGGAGAGPDLRSPVAWAMIALTVLGGGWGMIGLVPLVAMKKTRAFAVALTATLIGTSAVVFFAKMGVGRVRPLHSLPGVRGLFDAPTDFSFPSGHAAGSFAFAAFVSTVLLTRAAPRRPFGVVAGVAALFTVAFGVAVSRVYLGCHFPGDVAAGAAVGLFIGSASARMYCARRVPEPSTPT